MNVLLSVKPKYVEKMAYGTKRYEFRKSRFRREVRDVWIYATAPTSKIVGAFPFRKVVEDTPQNLWEITNGASGISQEEFFAFFSGRRVGFAMEIEDLRLLDDPVSATLVFPAFKPPRSFRYFDRNLIQPWEGLARPVSQPRFQR